jgi:hypothetical protein
MHPIHAQDLTRLHIAELTRLASTDAGRLRRQQRDAEPERYPLPPAPRLAVGRLVARLRAAVHVGAGA